MYVCACVCVCVCRERERDGEKEIFFQKKSKKMKEKFICI